MSFMFRDRKDTEFSYGSTFDDNFNKKREMKKKISNFSMAIHFRDTDFCYKEIFETKILALDWFDSFVQVNKRPVTITFYYGVTPYWVYRKDKD